VLRARAVLLAEQGKVEAAMADFDKAIAMQPKDPSGYEAKALVLAKLKKYDEALATVDALIKAEPALKAASRFRAMLLAEAGRKDEAIAEIEKLYQGDTKDLATAMSLAMLYTSAKKSAKAVEIYTAVLAQDAGNPAALRGRADALLNVGRQSEALADYEKALKLAPKDSGLLNNLAWLLATSPDDKLRDGKRAVTLATEACELTDYKAPHILSTLGAAYAEAGDFANAIKWVEKGLESANDDEKKSLTKELESYRAGKPFREVLADKEEAPQESKKEEPKKDEPKPEEPKKP
jgi:tetratricopeptide (TPR) repeat protein